MMISELKFSLRGRCADLLLLSWAHSEAEVGQSHQVRRRPRFDLELIWNTTAGGFREKKGKMVQAKGKRSTGANDLQWVRIRIASNFSSFTLNTRGAVQVKAFKVIVSEHGVGFVIEMKKCC
jgi:hypothetical protein